MQSNAHRLRSRAADSAVPSISDPDTPLHARSSDIQAIHLCLMQE